MSHVQDYELTNFDDLSLIFLDTPILDGTARAHSLDKDVLLEKLARQIPLKFVGEPDDIANAVLYLASDESRFLSGSVYMVDGGMSC